MVTMWCGTFLEEYLNEILHVFFPLLFLEYKENTLIINLIISVGEKDIVRSGYLSSMNT